MEKEINKFINGVEKAKELRKKTKRQSLFFVAALGDFVFQAFDVIIYP